MVQPENNQSETYVIPAESACDQALLRPGRSLLGHYAKPFGHRELLLGLDKAPVVKKDTLINRINYLHFTGEPLHLHLQYTGYQDELLIPVSPEPCDGDRCTCRLPCTEEEIFNKYTIQYLFVPNGQDVLIVPAHMQLVQEGSIAIQLPDKSYKVNKRRNQRYEGRDLSAVLSQNAFQAKGELVDFSPVGLSIRLDLESISSMRWFNKELPVLLQLSNGTRRVFTSSCRCLRAERRHLGRQHLILVPGNEESHQFSKQKMRNPRHRLTPSFSVSFDHPFIGKKVRRQVHDITTSGFSIMEETDESLLLPGLILSDLTILYAGIFEIKCLVTQVVYRTPCDDQKVRCGWAIMDMDLKNYTKLANILMNALDPHAQISCEVDLDDLWDFFFESGFIYPQKYRSIYLNRSEFKETYKKLYESDPDIVRHFTYQKSGRIHGHISLVRAYEKSWMFHHLAAKSMDGKRTGPAVMKQITHFIHDLYRFPSANMDYYMCYYQPKNRFSNFIFGGFAKQMDDLTICSEDLFSYFIHPKRALHLELPEKWHLEHFTPDDLFELGQFYDHVSGGLLLEVLRLGRESHEESSVEAAYARCGFARKSGAYSLLHAGILKAVLLVNQTDFGFNLTNLLNCVKVVICDPDGLPWEVLVTALDRLVQRYPTASVPILLYPSIYLETHRSKCQSKEYILWVSDARHVGDFMVTTKQQGKIGHWE